MKGITILLVFLAAAVAVSESKVFCYYSSWATYRKDDRHFEPENIDVQKCSHITYSFVGLNADGTVRLLDEWNDQGKKTMERFVNLKQKQPSLKVLVSMGGWNEGSGRYSQVIGNPGTRSRLVNSVFDFVKQHRFDGFDLDWEYPASREGSNPNDKHTYIDFLRDLRGKFGRNFLITAAVGAGPGMIGTNYDVPAMNQWLDFINLMTYDYNSPYDGRTGQNAPLYAHPNDINKQNNIDATVNAWIRAGANSWKLFLGLAFYAKTFQLANAAHTDIGAQTYGSGNPGPISSQQGLLMYSEICEELKRGGWTEKYEGHQHSMIAYKGNQWWGYDNVQTIKKKCQYAMEKRLAGVMVWAVDYDDNLNRCNQGSNPLLSAIHSIVPYQ